MKRNLLNPDLNMLNFQFRKTIAKVTRENNQINFSKEELLLHRLQNKLGKSKEEVTKMISKNLLNLLTMVPFSSENK